MEVGSENWLHLARMPAEPDGHAIGQRFLQRPDHFTLAGTPEQFYSAFVENDRDFGQRILAGYGMGSTRLGRLQLQGGVRWERTTTRSKEWDPRTSAEVRAAGFPVNNATRRATTIPGMPYQFFSQPRVTRTGEYDKWFPGVSGKYAFTDSLNLHLGYNRAISRPPVTALHAVDGTQWTRWWSKLAATPVHTDWLAVDIGGGPHGGQGAADLEPRLARRALRDPSLRRRRCATHGVCRRRRQRAADRGAPVSRGDRPAPAAARPREHQHQGAIRRRGRLFDSTSSRRMRREWSPIRSSGRTRRRT
jgi:hypothetical protein